MNKINNQLSGQLVSKISFPEVFTIPLIVVCVCLLELVIFLLNFVFLFQFSFDFAQFILN